MIYLKNGALYKVTAEITGYEPGERLNKGWNFSPGAMLVVVDTTVEDNYIRIRCLSGKRYVIFNAFNTPISYKEIMNSFTLVE